MESSVVPALSALAHPSRLGVFRILVRAGPEGLPAGEIAQAIGALPNTTSSHLNILSTAGLIVARRNGRNIFYAADYQRMRAVLSFLIEDCCNGRPEICDGLEQIVTASC